MTRVAACQVAIDIDDPAATRTRLDYAVTSAVGDGAELVVLPELSVCGGTFSSSAEAAYRAEPADGPADAETGAAGVVAEDATRGDADVPAPAADLPSDATAGAAYKTPAGFLELYGDYGELAINSAGKTVAIWGEGASWDGPGGVWFNREQ